MPEILITIQVPDHSDCRTNAIIGGSPMAASDESPLRRARKIKVNVPVAPYVRKISK